MCLCLSSFFFVLSWFFSPSCVFVLFYSYLVFTCLFSKEREKEVCRWMGGKMGVIWEEMREEKL